MAVEPASRDVVPTAPVVAVTGVTRGIGRFVAEHFLNQGARVFGIARGKATLTHERYVHLGETNVADFAQVQKAFRDIKQAAARLDVLINNAGTLTSQFALILPPDKAAEMVQTNVLGSFYCAREAAKVMKLNRFGRIVQISSMAAVLEPAGDSVYAASKAGATSLSNVLAKEFASFGITVNTLGITAIETEMMAKIPREKLDEIVAQLPIPRFATPEDILNVIDFLTSPRSNYVTAQTIHLGGLHA